MIQILALAYRKQIHNGNTWLFAESGKPWKALELSSENWAAVNRGIIVRSGFLTNEAAWSWIDCNTDNGRKHLNNDDVGPVSGARSPGIFNMPSSRRLLLLRQHD